MIQYDAHRWTDHLFDIRGSMVRQIVGRLALFVGWSVLVVLFHENVRPVGVPSTLHSLVGLALGLLLVFRTNASYDRFWEGRKAWGGIVNESRNLARSARGYLPASAPEVRPIILWTVAFCHATMHGLRGQPGLGEAAKLLPPHEVQQMIAGGGHLPFAVTRKITGLIDAARRRGELSDYLVGVLDQNVQQLVDYVGICERIHRTPLPFAYVVHLRRALILYFLTLPFALLDAFGWVTVLDTFVIAYVFFGIEEIGVQIEDPFGEDDNDLPLEAICETIRTNLVAVMDEPGETSSAGSG